MPETSKSIIILARVATAGTIFFALVMFVAFIFIQPDLNPLYRFGSEYAVGRLGWLMKMAFFLWGAGLLAFAIILIKGIDTAARSNIAIVLFFLGALGIFFSGVWDTDLQVPNEAPPPQWIESPSSPEKDLHNLAGFVGLFSLIAGAGFVSRRLRIENRLHGKYRALRILSWALPLAFVAFATVFVPYGLAGLGQRTFLFLLFAWILITIRGIAEGAFSPGR
jgi:hypothetical protein